MPSSPFASDDNSQTAETSTECYEDPLTSRRRIHKVAVQKAGDFKGQYEMFKLSEAALLS